MSKPGCRMLLSALAVMLAAVAARADGAEQPAAMARRAIAVDAPPNVAERQAVARDVSAEVGSRHTASAKSEDRPIGRGERLARSNAASGTVAPRNSGMSLWPLAVVLGVIGLGVWAAKRWLPQVRTVGGNGAIRVLARQYLSPKQSICLVRFGKTVLLVGVSADRMETLARIEDADEAAILAGYAERDRANSLSHRFEEMLSGAAGRFDEPSLETRAPNGARDAVGTRETFRGLARRLRELGTIR